ncbi:hypothetical protein [Flavobacterium sp. ACAM 123]|uniref:AprA-related methyltransferase n=1 Tax=Flavobacterium sp. ACAM 123 TaxID=1189620 RepID=UPI0002DDD1C3|nr:hypothetical protein [Flavobacterium sp. ACAM 123]
MHIEGTLVGPASVRLGMIGMFHKFFLEISFGPEESHKFPDNFKTMLDFFVHLVWFTLKVRNYLLREVGLFFAKRAAAYGVTVSYSPIRCKMNNVLFGNARILKTVADAEDEVHVHLEMNVWRSSYTYESYFKVVDKIAMKLFNLPIEDQSKRVLDKGCGNVAFLEHVFAVIERQTLKGQMLPN